MRLTRRLHKGKKGDCSCIALGLLLTLSACSLPQLSVERDGRRVSASNAGFYINNDAHTSDDRIRGHGYLATVHVLFTPTQTEPVTFDLRRDGHETVSFNVMETKETTTYLHLGYSHDDGETIGVRFRWRY